MSRQQYMYEINKKLSTLQYQLCNENKAGYNDINKYLETTFTYLLNLIYKYELTNLNTIRAGEPAIDLIDDKHKICIQVTSTDSSTKIKNTIEKLKETKRDVNKYKLKILVLKMNAKSRTNYVTDTQFFFNPREDIIDFSTLISAISGLEIEEIKAVLDLLNKELEYNTAPSNGTNQLITSSNSITDSIRKIIKISSPYIKGITLHYLCNDDKANLLDIINRFNLIKNTAEWENLNDVFTSYINFGKKSKSYQDSLGENIFDALCRIIESYEKVNEKICMIIQGQYRTGKSMFSSLLFLNLLNDYVNNMCNTIPIYINLEKIPQKDLIHIFNSILNESYELSIEYNKKLCLILDGVPQFNYYQGNNNSIEIIYNMISGNRYSELIERLVLCIDINHELAYGYSPFYLKLESDNIVYVDPVTIKNQTISSRHLGFVKAFCKLEKRPDAEKNVLKNIISLKLKILDFCTLTTLKDQLFSNEIIELSRELEVLIEDKLRGSTVDIATASRIAYTIYYDHSPFNSVQKQFKSFGNAEISALINLVICNEIFAHYLLAVYYVNTIKNIVENRKPSRSIKNLVVLNRLYGDQICSYIIGYINQYNLSETIVEFSEKYFESLRFSGQSMCIYILGRIRNGTYLDKKRLGILESQIDSNYNSLNKPSDLETYDYHVAKRSLAISRIRVDKEYRDSNYYILLLLKDKTVRKINRDFYLEYYGDRQKVDSTRKYSQEIITAGLDFFNTYHILATSLAKYKSKKDDISLFRLELFTICDLIQTRLDNEYITHKTKHGQLEEVLDNTPENKSFFYNELYNSASKKTAVSVIDFVINTLRLYIRDNSNRLDTDIFIQYLRYELQLFESVSCKLKENRTDFQFEHNALLENMTKLETTRRIGWNIREKTSSIDQNDIDNILNNEPELENVLQHTFEMFLIALLYLPESSGSEGYDKKTVINLIWIHDLGEAVIKDYPPFFDKFIKKKAEERIVCQEYYLAGTHPQYATMIEYLELWNSWSNKNRRNINSQIAIDIDKLQMIYKLLIQVNRNELNQNNFSHERVKEILESAYKIESAEVKAIFNTLIANNEDFKSKIMNVYSIPISILD